MSTVPSARRGRKQVGPIAPWIMACLAASLLAGLVVSDRIFVSRADFALGQSAPYTVRTSPLQPSPLGANGGAIIVGRGEVVGAAQQQLARAERAPSPGQGVAIYLAIFGLLLAWSSYLRVQHWTKGLRRQLVILGTVLLLSLAMRAIFLLTSVSILAAPVALVGLLLGRRSTRGAAVASAALTALLIAAMVPLELGIVAALALQAIVPPLLLPRNATPLRTVLALAAAGAASALAYAIAYAATWQNLPSLSDPLHSTWVAALLGAGLSASLFLALRTPFDWLCGEVSKRRLSNLERLSQPLLRQMATQAPGTWQHSLAMAKLAQPAGLAIGADVHLLRVGAYYHDIGKSLAPKYFNENLGGGESSVHENLKPSASRDAIFAHVNEGIRLARENGLPSRLIDFISSHHGTASLEYFWAMEQAQSKASNAKAVEFHYPGTRAQCRETGILCICDAVEGASRNLKSPSREVIEGLVHHIVYGKLRAGQLDDSGLSLADAKAIDLSLVESLVQAHAPDAPRARGADAVPTTDGRRKSKETLQKAAPLLAQLSLVRLDSLDRPSPNWQPTPSDDESPFGGDKGMAFVETEAMDTPQDAKASPDERGSEIDTQQEPRSTASFEARREKALQNPKGAGHSGKAAATTDHLRTRERTAERDPEERSTMPQKVQNSGVADRLTAPGGEAGLEDRLTDKRPVVKRPDSEDRVTAPREAMPRSGNDDTSPGTRRSVQPVQGGDEDSQEPVLLESPIRVEVLKKEAGAASSLDQWNEALEGAQDDKVDPATDPPMLPPPPPGSPSVTRETIPLGTADIQVTPAPPVSRPSKRADSSAGLRPGEMVVGAPPSTHPERTLPGIMPRDEITAEHEAVMPDEARRPEDRITEESPAVMPMEAYPETVSAPGPIPRKPSGDDER